MDAVGQGLEPGHDAGVRREGQGHARVAAIEEQAALGQGIHHGRPGLGIPGAPEAVVTRGVEGDDQQVGRRTRAGAEKQGHQAHGRDLLSARPALLADLQSSRIVPAAG